MNRISKFYPDFCSTAYETEAGVIVDARDEAYDFKTEAELRAVPFVAYWLDDRFLRLSVSDGLLLIIEQADGNFVRVGHLKRPASFLPAWSFAECEAREKEYAQAQETLWTDRFVAFEVLHAQNCETIELFDPSIGAWSEVELSAWELATAIVVGESGERTSVQPPWTRLRIRVSPDSSQECKNSQPLENIEP